MRDKHLYIHHHHKIDYVIYVQKCFAAIFKVLHADLFLKRCWTCCFISTVQSMSLARGQDVCPCNVVDVCQQGNSLEDLLFFIGGKWKHQTLLLTLIWNITLSVIKVCDQIDLRSCMHCSGMTTRGTPWAAGETLVLKRQIFTFKSLITKSCLYPRSLDKVRVILMFETAMGGESMVCRHA